MSSERIGTTAEPRGPPRTHALLADAGIDGYINVFDDKSGKAKQVIVQVKSG